jgi:mRNA interferase RelE/StbE
MAKYTVFITKSVQKQLQNLPDEIAGKIEQKMLQLEDDPRPIDCKKLRGRDGFRVRVGNYRIIYEVKDKILVVVILKVGHRKDIYL